MGLMTDYLVNDDTPRSCTHCSHKRMEITLKEQLRIAEFFLKQKAEFLKRHNICPICGDKDCQKKKCKPVKVKANRISLTNEE